MSEAFIEWLEGERQRQNAGLARMRRLLDEAKERHEAGKWQGHEYSYTIIDDRGLSLGGGRRIDDLCHWRRTR